VLFTNATLFASPVTTGPLGGMDWSIPAGMIVGGLAYYLLCRRAIARESASAPDAVAATGAADPVA
jgi:hypothetical protein